MSVRARFLDYDGNSSASNLGAARPGALIMDTVSPQRRSEIMSRIRSRNTSPEITVRKYLHARGLRFRLHQKDLPGRPDIVFVSRRVCVFVHGCFWHGCPNCIDGTRRVKSNIPFWTDKVAGNRARDARHKAELEAQGWHVVTIWECETADPSRLAAVAQAVATIPTPLPRAGAPV
jgi:DNA mismatch endonuclease (patch repair protein)